MNNQQADPSNSSSIEIGDVLKGIWKRKSWMFFTTALAAIGSVYFVMTATPVYKSETRVLVENLETSLTQLGRQRVATQRVDQQEVISQVEVMQSRDLALRVIKDLNLLAVDEYDPLKQGIGTISQLLISLGFKADPAKQTPEQRALAVYYKKFTAYQIPLSKVIVVDVKSVKPRRAAEIANKLSEEFVATTREVQSKTTGRARDWLADQISTLRKKVIASEVAAEKFRAQAGLLKGRDVNTTLSSQELSELNSQIILAEAQRSEIQARAKAIRTMLANRGSVEGSSEVLNAPLIQRLRERQITLQGNIADLSTTYLPNHPRIKSVRRELSGLRRQIRSEALKIVSGLEQQAKVASARESSLRASLNNLKTRASGTNLDEVKLRALEREATANSALLKTFLSKYTDASARNTPLSQPGRARIISTAQISPEPYFPKPGPTVVLATLGGFFLSAGLAFMASVMSAVGGATGASRRRSRQREPHLADAQIEQTIQQLEEPLHEPAPQPVASVNAPAAVGQQNSVEQSDPLKQRYLEPEVVVATQSQTQPEPQKPVQVTKTELNTTAVSVPSLSLLPPSNDIEIAVSNARSVIQNPQGPYANGIGPVASWANSVRQTLGVTRIGVVGIPGSDVDTAAACLALARSLSVQNVRTIIVDAAMQGSKLAEMTGTGEQPGLADLITGHAPFLEVIIKDDVSDVRILRVGQRTALAWPLLASDRMETVLSALESGGTHDIVIVHAGHLPAENMTENGALAKCKSSLLLVQADQLAVAGNAMKILENAGMTAGQFVRIGSDGGLQHRPDNITPLDISIMASQTGQQAPSPQVAASMEMPQFSKVAG